MEWVIAILAVGCAFLVLQIVMDYFRYKAVIGPRIERLESAKKDLEIRIEASKDALVERQEKLGPAKEEVEKLEQEYQDLQEQVRQERERRGRREPGGDRFTGPA